MFRLSLVAEYSTVEPEDKVGAVMVVLSPVSLRVPPFETVKVSAGWQL